METRIELTSFGKPCAAPIIAIVLEFRRVAILVFPISKDGRVKIR